MLPHVAGRVPALSPSTLQESTLRTLTLASPGTSRRAHPADRGARSKRARPGVSHSGARLALPATIREQRRRQRNIRVARRVARALFFAILSKMSFSVKSS